ncbi:MULTISPECIES: hypothetical protein [Streptomyces]|uniref:Uncharacterized protein n=1 Tax=Streptomyces griseofuscus TaxID=146922 RepID=A0A7H1QD68_9ACTN|nr:hypothetical protein [Streptomyces murinus]MBA9050532.1 hypothetical protein [Streptomyces murinus]QNT98248.1 hypothetical protein HEP81_08020 [Streptomyces griseofuscus]
MGRPDEDGLLFANEADSARLCRGSGCADILWNQPLLHKRSSVALDCQQQPD